jgi:hypothetical protein
MTTNYDASFSQLTLMSICAIVQRALAKLKENENDADVGFLSQSWQVRAAKFRV